MKLLEKWMADYEEELFNNFLKTEELYIKWVNARHEQRKLEVNGYHKESSVEIAEMKSCCCWNISSKWRRENFELDTYSDKLTATLIIDTINIDGVDYEDLLYSTASYKFRRYESYERIQNKYNGLRQLLEANGCNINDVEWVSDHTEAQYRDRAHKEMIRHKQAIEAKVKKICGDTITQIEETYEIRVVGSNGRTARIWAIEAGGYNIQRLHVRVLVKEVK